MTSYRFLLEGGPSSYAWLNGTGLHLRDVPDAADFRLVTYDAPPAWALDAVVYQIFPDRFAKAVDRAAPELGGSRGLGRAGHDDRSRIAARSSTAATSTASPPHLDHIESLGATVVYLTPFFPSRSNHRYDASSFDARRPAARWRRGAGPAGRRLPRPRAAGHGRLHHQPHRRRATSGSVAPRRTPTSDERGFYLYEDGDYVSWLGVPSLPKLNYDSAELRRRVFDDPDGVVRRGSAARAVWTAGGSTWPT